MIALKQYDALTNQVIHVLKRSEIRSIKEIINDIITLEDLATLANQNVIPQSTVNYQCKSLKCKYNEELGEIIKLYQDLIFPELSFNTDINNMVVSPNNLKIWLLRYVSYQSFEESLASLIDESFSKMTITEQYQCIDVKLYTIALNKKVKNS